MAREPAIIDLGTYRYDALADAAPPVPGSGPARRRWWVAVMRRWGVPVAALLVLIPAGAAAPAAPALQAVWSAPVDDERGPPLQHLEVDGERAYLVTAVPGTERWLLTAYRLADGGQVWHRSLAGSNLPGMRLAGPTLVVTTGGRNLEPSITGYDPATGQRRWTRPEVPVRVVGDDLMILMGRIWPPERPGDLYGGERELIPVDPRTGRDLGGIVRVGTDDPFDIRHRPDGGRDLLTLGRDGVVTRLDLLTGDVLARVRTPHRERAANAAHNGLSVGGGLALVRARGGGAPPAVSAYDPVTLAHRWDAPPGAEGAMPCGPVVCVTAQVGRHGALYGLDPASGGIRWTLSCASGQAPGQECHLHAAPLADGRVFVEWHMAGAGPPGEWDRTTARVVDAGSGRARSAASRWQIAPLYPAGRVPEADELLLVRREPVRPDSADGEPPRFWWARAGTDLAGPVVLGTTGPGRCRPYPPYLFCETERGLTAWRIGS